MSARIHWFALSIAIPLLVTTASNAAAGAWSLDPGEFYSQIHGSWFSSDTYYDQNGGRAFLHGGGLWEERSLVSYNELGWKPKLSFILGIPVKSVTRQMGGPEPHALATATGPADGLFGLRYRLANGRRAMALELDWIPPLSYERSRFLTHADSVAAGDSNGDGDSLDANAARQIGSPTLGDGVQNLALNFQFGLSFNRGFFEGSGGFKYRFEEPTNQVLLGADLGFWLTKGLLVAGRYRGLIASEGTRPTDEPVEHRVGPLLLYRVDQHMDLFVATMHSAAGTNTLHTDEIFAGFAFKQTKLNRLQGYLGGVSPP
jgi:hypothetical protein